MSSKEVIDYANKMFKAAIQKDYKKASRIFSNYRKEENNLLEKVNGKDKAPGNEDGHYTGKIQPIDFIEDQQLSFHEANIVKYISRWKRKGQLEDLYKVAWYLNRLIKFVEKDGIKVYVDKAEYESLLNK